MENVIEEIAAILRSTEDMALQFIKRVESRVGQPLSHAEVLAAIKKVPTRNLSMEKVVAKVQQQHKQKGRQVAQRRAIRATKTAAASSHHSLADVAPATGAERRSESDDSADAAPRPPKTMLERLGGILQENWDRAETEGLNPQRLSAEAFMSAVYQYTDRRIASRQRILRAAQELNQEDVVLTPALVADAAQKLFEG